MQGKLGKYFTYKSKDFKISQLLPYLEDITVKYHDQRNDRGLFLLVLQFVIFQYSDYFYGGGALLQT